MSKPLKPKDFAMQIGTDAMRWRSAAVSALYDEATRVINKSIPITPFDTGDLRRSAFVSMPTASGANAIEVELGYGGLASQYALAVHEMPKGTNWQEPGTGSKYLEKPFDAATRGQAKRIELNAMKRFLSGFTVIVPTQNTRPT